MAGGNFLVLLQWAEFVIRYLTDGPFGRKHHLKQDLSGVIEFYRFRQELELKLLKKLPFPALVIPDRGSWQQRLDAIAEELLNEVSCPSPPVQQLPPVVS